MTACNHKLARIVKTVRGRFCARCFKYIDPRTAKAVHAWAPGLAGLLKDLSRPK